MKPHSVVLHPYRSLDDFYSITVHPVTVIFGRNNAGKSNTLRAIADLLDGKASTDHLSDLILPRPASDFGAGRFWVDAPEDGTRWDQALRRDIYSTWIANEVKSRLGRRPIPEDTKNLLDGLAEKSLDELAWLVVHLESSFSGTEPIELTSETPESTPARVAFRELLRRCLIAFSSSSTACGFPETLFDPELVDLVAEATRDFIIDTPEDWQVGMPATSYSETAVLLADGIRYPLSRLRPTLVSGDWEAATIANEIETFFSTTRRGDDTPHSWPEWAEHNRPWLVTTRGSRSYEINPSVRNFATELESIANQFLPGFVNGALHVDLTRADRWDQGHPRLRLRFFENGRDEFAGDLSDEGSGVARWAAMALRLAMHVLRNRCAVGAVSAPGQQSLDGYVILLDEPEAHLHPAAVRDVVEWISVTSNLGACVVVATHHEEFLNNLQPDAALIHVNKPDRPTESHLRQLDMRTVQDLKQLAEDVGISASAAFGLFSAVLYVEGPLDVAVLDEFAGRRLEAVGVLLIPIHGTRNLEGLVTSEVIQHLGCKQGILLDATDVPTIRERPNKRLSTEEKKVLRVLDIARERGGAQPRLFGVTVRDLLYSCDEEGLRDFSESTFPGWTDIDREAREYFGADGSQSVNWKRYVNERYRIPFETEDGVREVIRWLDLHGFTNETLVSLIDEIVEWATSAASDSDDGQRSTK